MSMDVRRFNRHGHKFSLLRCRDGSGDYTLLHWRERWSYWEEVCRVISKAKAIKTIDLLHENKAKIFAE